MYNLSFKIITHLEKRGLLQGEDREIIAYGLFSFAFNAYCLVLCIIIGLLLNIAVESVIFFCSFLFIRRYAGGYHAKKEWMCLILSTLGIFISNLLIRFCISYISFYIAYLLASFVLGIMICLLSPLEADNKPLDAYEIKRYKKSSVIRIVITFAVIVLLFFVNEYSFVISIMASIIFENFLIVVGYIQKLKRKFDSQNAVL
jgi:accessory gene regulator B